VAWLLEDRAEPFLDLDRLFYLALYSSLFAFTGLLIGFLWSLSRKES